jgi:hypothetical protein
MTASAPVAAAVVVLAARCVLLQRRLADRDRYECERAPVRDGAETMTPQEPRKVSSRPAMHRLRVGSIRLTVWPRSLPWLLEVGRRQWWLFDRGQNLG